MPLRSTLLAIPLLFAAACGSGSGSETPFPGPGGPVLTDGRFGDWRGVEPLLDDPVDAPVGSAVDLDDLHLQDDPAYLHLVLETGGRINPQFMTGTILLVLDGDGDRSTGGEAFGVRGIDAVVELAPRTNSSPGGYLFGAGIRAVHPGGPGRLQSSYSAGLRMAPTTTTDRLEMRLNRGFALEGGPPLLASDSLRLRVVYRVDGGILDRTEVASYRFSEPVGVLAAEPTDTRRPPGTFRVLQWNVSGERFRRQAGPYARILGALAPDVILLDELSGGTSVSELQGFFGIPPLDSLGPWTVVIGASGGRQRAAVAVRSPWAHHEVALSEVIEYPPGSLERLAERVNDESFRALLDRERQRGIAAVAAWAEVEGRLALLVALDLQSRGFEGSSEDLLRQLQARTLRDRIGSALEGTTGQTVIMGGDFNLVGSRRPLEILAAGLDVDGSDLETAEPYRLADRSQTTWTDWAAGPFAPGRLDYVLYPSQGTSVAKSFVFASDELTEEERLRLGVREDDSANSSNHMPVVVDLRWK